MLRELIIYPNASKGGISSVIRGRAVAQPQVYFDALFFQDRGGSEALADLPNVRSAIIPKGRIEAAAKYLDAQNSYTTISILSAPHLVKHLSSSESHIRYEFHSSDMNVNRREIESLELGQVDEITVPSTYMADAVRPLVPKQHRRKLAVLPNLVDDTIFRPHGSDVFYHGNSMPSTDKIPLVWVGRFDEGKGYRHFIRTLAALPEEFYGIVVVSLESDPQRASSFFNECNAMGVSDRVEVYLNQPQHEMAKLYRWVGRRGGFAVSTSLLESFGYFVAEATACNLPVIAFDLPVWDEHLNRELITTVPTGSVTSLVNAIRKKFQPERI